MNLSRVKIPLDETGAELTIEIKDAVAREEIAAIARNISGTMSFLGETTTPISAGSGINPIEIDGQDFTAAAGTCVSSRGTIFLYDGRRWRTFGAVADLRALAYKDEVEAEYQPEGTITKPTFYGKTAVMTATIVPRGRIDFSQEDVAEEEANFIAEGRVTAPSVTVVPNLETIMAYKGGGKPPTCEFPKLTMHTEGENLVFSLEEGSFDPGSAATGGEPITVVTGIKEARAGEPQFHGTPKKLTGAFVGQSSPVDLEYTPEGEITTPEFRGTPVTITSK